MAKEIVNSVIGGGDLLFPGSVYPIVKRKAEVHAKQSAYTLALPVKDLILSLKVKMDITEIADSYSMTPCL